MLVRYYNEVALAASDVESALLDDPGSWLPRLAVRTEDHARSRLVEVGFGADRYRIEKLVEIELGEPVQLGSKTVLPIRWHATGASGLFPALEADLEVAPLGPRRTQIALAGRYDPPFGVLGEVVDRLLLHRVAEATVKDFVDALAEIILARATERAP